MLHWKKIKGVEGLYQNHNGVYYARLTKPKKTFLSLKTNKVKIAKKKILQVLTKDKLQVTTIKHQLPVKSLVRLFIKEELDTLKVTQRTKLRVKQGLAHIKNIPNVWNADLDSIFSKKELGVVLRNYANYQTLPKIIRFMESIRSLILRKTENT